VHEGGFVDNPKDPGGATNKGVTQATYNTFRTRKGQPKRSVRDIEVGELEELYFNGYWLPARCHEMPNEALALLMFDAAVNHGPATAIKLLQQAAGVPDRECDGVWGANTRTRVIQAAANANALVDGCLLRRERFYRRIVELNPKLGDFLRGWMNRLTLLRQRLQPLLARAPSAGDTESALYEDDQTRVPLVGAEPDFSGWDVRSTSPDAIAAQ
jgi:lysozyme family protein